MADKTTEQRLSELEELLGDRRHPRATVADLERESKGLVSTTMPFAVRFDAGGTSYFETFGAAYHFAAYGTRAPCIVAEWREGQWHELHRFV
jgi:hypothetical protein